MAVRLANSTEVTAENFFKNFLKLYQTQKLDDPMIEIKEMKTKPKLAKHVLINALNPRLTKAALQLPTTVSTSAEPIDAGYEHSTPVTSTTVDFLSNQDAGDDDDDDSDDDTETDAEPDYESSGQKNWNDTTILLDEDRNNVWSVLYIGRVV